MASPLIFLPAFVPVDLANRVMAEAAAWFAEAKRTVKIMGHVIPRDELAVFFDDVQPYRYGNHDMATMPACPLLHELRTVAREAAGGGALDLVVINRYVGGRDSVSFHADDEPVIDQNGAIVSLSFNEANGERTFLVRPKKSAGRRKSEKWRLAHGDVAVMPAGMQETHEHAIAKEKHVTGTRINFTFRSTRAVPQKRRRA